MSRHVSIWAVSLVLAGFANQALAIASLRIHFLESVPLPPLITTGIRKDDADIKDADSKEVARQVAPHSMAETIVPGSLATHTKAKDHLVWILGCSIDSQAFVGFCLNKSAVIHGDVGIKETKWIQMEKWTQIPDKNTKWCEVDGVTLFFTFHPGATPPPYYDFYVFDNTTQDIVKSGAKLILQTFGKTPDATIVDSSLWDVANWWTKDGKPQNWVCPHENIRHWSTYTVPRFLKFVQDTVPRSRIAFRSPPPIFNSCVPGFYYMCKIEGIVEEMYSSLLKSTDNPTHQLYGKYHLLDYRKIALSVANVSGYPVRAYYGDTAHPNGLLSIPYMTAAIKWGKGL